MRNRDKKKENGSAYEHLNQVTSEYDDDNIPEIDTKSISPQEDDRPRRDGPGGN